MKIKNFFINFMFIAIFGIIFAFSVLANAYASLIFFIALCYLWLIFKFPEIALFISFLVIVDCFSMADENFLRVPFLFRIRDVFLLLMFLPLVEAIYRKDSRIKYVFGGPIAKGIYLIILLTLVQMFFTHLRFGSESFNSIIRIGRKYFYYALFFPALYIFLDEVRFRRFSNLFIASTIIFCLLYIGQFLIGPEFSIFLKGRVEYQTLHGFCVPRIYVSGESAATLILHISFMMFLLCKNLKYRAKNVFLLMLLGFQALITFGRAHIFGVATGTLFALSSVETRIKAKAVFGIFILILVFFIMLSVLTFFSSSEKDFLQAIFARITSAYDAVSQQKDTFGYRIKDSASRIGLIIKNPIFGIGFVHDESYLFARATGSDNMIRTGDSGIIVLLIDFGIIGLIWLLTMAYIVLKRSLIAYKTTLNQLYKACALGVVAFYFGRLFSFFTLGEFVSYDGIVVIVLSLALLETINYEILSVKNE